MTALFSWVNAVDTAVLAAGDASANLPVTFLADPIVQKPWRSGTSISTYFTADFGANTAIDVVALFGCTLAATDTVRIRLSTVSLGAGDVLDTTALACNVVEGYGQYVYLPATTKTARYMRVDIAAASRSVEGYFDIGRCFVGAKWSPSITFSYGWGEDWQDDSQITSGKATGVSFVDPETPYRVLDVTFDWLSDADRTQAMTLARVAGKRSQILFVPNTAGDLATGPLLGRITASGPVRQNLKSTPSVFSKTYSLKQDL